ncbi:DUF4199 domain-containing protein [bacterium]|nr:DUF4199 domain-containing protein [bacterium]
MKKIVLRYGIISGSIIAGFMLISMLFLWNKTDYQASEIIGYASMVIAFSLIPLGINKLRKNEYGGKISFKDSFITGLLISLICSIFYVGAWMLITSLKPEVSTEIMNSYIENIKTQDLSQAELDKKVEEASEFAEQYNNNPMIKMMWTFVEILPLGILISLISAIIFIFIKTPNHNDTTIQGA